MKKSLFVALCTMFVVLGFVGAGIAQQAADSSATAQTQSKPGDSGKDTSSATSSASAPKADNSKPDTSASAPSPGASSGSSTTVEVKPSDQKPGAVGDSDVSASPRSSSSGRKIFGLDPTAAVLIAAAILVVVVLALVAMARGGSETVSRTDIDLDRRL